MNLSSLTAVSPLDGRYAKKTEKLRPLFSEYGLIHKRLFVEIKWLIFLNNTLPELKLNEDAINYLESLHQNFNEEEALKIKDIEKKTNHDIKAIEYYLKDKIEQFAECKKAKEFVHFGCTSDDINNLAYALILQKTRETIFLPTLKIIFDKLKNLAHEFSNKPLLARTHGQPATPTTMGKEIINIVARLERQIHTYKTQLIFGKINGAVGNFNAHHIAYPDLPWPILAREFTEQLGLNYNAYTTQIEPHDYIAEYSQDLFRINTILIDLSRDIWSYISLGYFSQKKIEDEVGSSTMPHKINPIDFENAEGNLSLANALWHFFAERLPISRWQRDLVDSTLLRNLGVAHAHSLIAYESLLTGLNKLILNESLMTADLNAHWEVLTEAIQTVMRRYGIEQPYERLKALSRGEKINEEQLHLFIDSLNLPKDVSQKLKELTPTTYLGFAKQLTHQL